MNSRRHRVFGLLASTVTAALLAAPVTAAGNGSGSFGTRASQRSNPILRNDIAHFGSSGQLSAPGTPIVVRVDGGFDWAAAGVGAAGGLGLVLVAGVATSALRSRRRVDTARA
jgi:hypothetical protein